MKILSKTLIALSIFTVTASSLYAGNHQKDTTFVKVTYSEPIYTYVSKNVKECYQVPVQKKVYKHNSGYNSNSIGVDTIVGATIGVVIGNQIGKGNGKDAAKIVGGLLGATVANASREDRYSSNSYDARNDYSYETSYETRCEIKKHHRQEKVITGYKNYFNFKGREYTKISDEPLRRVRIEHSISF